MSNNQNKHLQIVNMADKEYLAFLSRKLRRRHNFCTNSYIVLLLQILNTMLVLLVFIGLNLAASSWAYGPSFVRTPSQTVLYSNTTGLILDCVARGEPPPVIDWVDQNGNILSIHPSYAR